MTAPFQTVYPDEIKIPATRIASLVSTYRERQRTGLIRLAYSGDKQIYLMFRSGSVLNGYLVNDGSHQRLEKWQETIASSPDAFARLIQLSTFALQMCKLSIESQSDQSRPISALDIRSSLTGTWKQANTPSVLHLGWKTAEALVLYSGIKSKEHSVFFTSNRLVDEAGITDSIALWGEPQATVTSYSMKPDQPAWQEYFLRRAFAEICERSLARYERITGRAVVDSVIRSLILAASRRSAEINITGRQLIDREIFSTPEAAAETYREILQTMLDQISTIIGAHLSSSILLEVTAEIPQEEHQMAHQFSLLPEKIYK